MTRYKKLLDVARELCDGRTWTYQDLETITEYAVMLNCYNPAAAALWAINWEAPCH